MRQLVESLRRLYGAKKLTEQQLNKLLLENKISQEEYEYILSK